MVNAVKKNKLITAANFRDFDWNKAKLFYHLAKCGGFTKAARLAGVDQSVLTRQIQTLEIQVGSRLVTRVPSGIILTRKGEELLEKIALHLFGEEFLKNFPDHLDQPNFHFPNPGGNMLSNAQS